MTPPKVATVPYIRMLKENNARKGFFERDDFLKLWMALPAYLRPIVTFGYRYGWRKAEIMHLTWDRVDLNLGIVRLGPGMPQKAKLSPSERWRGSSQVIEI